MDDSSSSQLGSCKTSVSFCGLRDRKYPDRRPMGYPFDRPPPDTMKSLEEFLTPNMAMTKISIHYKESDTDILPRPIAEDDA